jgi:hypothetical protein
LEITAARTLNYLYIYLDVAWLLIYILILAYRKRYLALLAGVAGGLIYFAVDFGIFFLLLGTRAVVGADPFWFLLWLSMSYGITNMAWIWLLLDRDGRAVEWSLLTILGWISVAFLSQNFGAGFAQISIQRGTTSYHGVMALALVVGYTYLIVRNLGRSGAGQVNLLWLTAIGVGVQFSWEAVLLLSGIRPAGILPLIVNSLIETNLGVPYLFLIHAAAGKQVREDLSKTINTATGQGLLIA